MVAPPPNQLIADGFDTGGAFTLCFAGETGRSYVIQASTNLLEGGGTTLGPVVSTNGLLQFRDITATHPPFRFYRAVGQ